METLRTKENLKRQMDMKTEKKKGKVSRSPDDPDHRPNDPASAQTIRTTARTIRLQHLNTPEASPRSRIIRTQSWIIRTAPDVWTRTRTSTPPAAATTQPDHPDADPDHPDADPDHPDPRSPDHPDQHPDHPDSACMHDVGPRPMYPFAPTSIYTTPPPLSRVSIGLAHL